jgi:hypothetical protein
MSLPETPVTPDVRVPAGPGAQPPFTVAPSEGRGTRLWWGLGAGALALIICVGGGGAAIVGIILTYPQMVKEQAQAAVRGYLDALEKKDYPAAYHQLCEQRQKQDSLGDFEATQVTKPVPSKYTLSGPEDLNLPLLVTADITYTNGDHDEVTYEVEQDSGTGALEVCGEH